MLGPRSNKINHLIPEEPLVGPVATLLRTEQSGSSQNSNRTPPDFGAVVKLLDCTLYFLIILDHY